MKKWVWVTLLILAVVLGATAVFYFMIWPNYKINITPIETPVTTISPSTIIKSVSDKGVTWIEPKKIDDLNLTVKPLVNNGIDTANIYYKIADLDDGGALILDVYQPDCPCLPEMLRFKKDAAGKYSYLTKISDQKDASAYKNIISQDVSIDSETIYKSLAAPETLTVKGVILKISSPNGLFADVSADSKEAGTTDYGKIYRSIVAKNTNGLTGVNYKLKLADSTYVTYINKLTFITDDEVAQVTWLDDQVNASKYTAESYTRCGMVASVNVMTDTVNITTRLIEIGKTESNDNVYTVKASDEIMKAAYDNYKIGREKDILTIDQFAAKKPIFIWKSDLGDYIVFTGREFAGLAECGKPVIYLYPTEETHVSVKVDAKISKSEPIYNNGWKVLAKPDGKLVVDGKEYGSLFWEGTGQEYPIIKQGTVVKKVDTIATIKDQLAKLGLNDKEIKEFIEFWAPKMPNTPYTRLTWIGTNDMNKLAPLTINPAPDTVIRVFLDFEGLSAPINIEPQRLVAISRKGFTVVEWGGLLR